MSYVHVGHNARVGAGAVLTNLAQLGGHAEVGEHAVLGAGAMVHQFARVGAYAMLGATSGVNLDVLPFTLARGNPARHFRLNAVGLRRHGITGERYRALERAVRALRRRDAAELRELAAASPDVALLATFRDTSRRGVAGFRTDA
jgi:UDP-N-acetylglucosamine acyltransferase